MAAVKTLLLSGANNHDWTRSSPFVRDLLNASGKFDVTLTEDPSAALENAEALQDFGLIFSEAFNPTSGVAGTGVGAFLVTLMWGVRRGLFSNEAGQGSAPIATRRRRRTSPCRRASWRCSSRSSTRS